jgi:hypothetical protein
MSARPGVLAQTLEGEESKLKDSIYLVVTKSGVDRMNKQQLPTLRGGEKVVQLDVEVADSFFAPKAVPRIGLKVENPYDGESAEIVVSEQQPTARGLNEAGQAQQKVNRVAARLLERGLRSSDQALQHEAIEILNSLKDQGIKVEIEIPAEDVEA